jgi:predicted TPR repeat methyltransferase
MTSEPLSLQDAIAAHKGGRLDEAAAGYRRILESEPRNPDALNFFGMLCCQGGDPTAGEELLRRAVEADPSNPHAWLNLGTALMVRKNPEGASTAFRKATELAPELPIAWYNLGVCLGRCKEPREAASSLHRALKLQPGHPPAYAALANVLHRLGEYTEAAEIYREWLKYEPNNHGARHLLAAVSQHEVPSRADERYVRQMFDDFADEFDENLNNLGYRAPEWVAARLANAVEARGGLEILDAGCGTGLCAPLLRPLARRLVGIDLSSNMVEKARQRGGYDELVVADLSQAMRERPDSFDAVVSADTLVYFGALEEPLAAARLCLREGGLIVFSVEQLIGSEQYHLEQHGRYSHSESYLRAALEGAGFGEVTFEVRTLRSERGAEVAGYVVLARAK